MFHCAKIVNTHGLAGEVKALIYADDPSFFDNIKKVYLKSGEGFTLLGVRQSKGAVLLKLKEITDISAAEALKGADLYVKREDAAPLPHGRYYIVDIIGCEVYTDAGRLLGKIIDVFKTGSNDVYTVKGDKEYLIPVIDEVIFSTDIENKKIVIKPLKGLIDDED